MLAMTKLKAIDKTLIEKWIPMSNAKSISELQYIFITNSKCYLCCVFKCAECLKINARDSGRNCCYEYHMFGNAYTRRDGRLNIYWAKKVTDKIKKLRERELNILKRGKEND